MADFRSVFGFIDRTRYAQPPQQTLALSSAPKKRKSSYNPKETYFSSYTLLVDTFLQYIPQNPANNRAIAEALEDLTRYARRYLLPLIAFNRITKESYLDQWNPQTIKNVKFAYTIEIGEKYRHYHTHIYFTISHSGLPNFGIDYQKGKELLKSKLSYYLQQHGYRRTSPQLPKPYVNFQLNKVDTAALLHRYLDKGANYVEKEAQEEDITYEWMQSFARLAL